ncbi:MAG: hypothetical protein QOI34_1853, partial [Verrucomicrobiota bacterium]
MIIIAFVRLPAAIEMPGETRPISWIKTMRKTALFKSVFFRPRVQVGLSLCSFAAILCVLSFALPETAPKAGPRLGVEKLRFAAKPSLPVYRPTLSDRDSRSLAVTTASNSPTFGHPVISGIGGTGFEESIRIDPTNPNRIYTSAPGTASADTSWIWHSLDGGRTFKWVVGATPLEGKATTCHGGGDTEI